MFHEKRPHSQSSYRSKDGHTQNAEALWHLFISDGGSIHFLLLQIEELCLCHRAITSPLLPVRSRRRRHTQEQGFKPTLQNNMSHLLNACIQTTVFTVLVKYWFVYEWVVDKPECQQFDPISNAEVSVGKTLNLASDVSVGVLCGRELHWSNVCVNGKTVV